MMWPMEWGETTKARTNQSVICVNTVNTKKKQKTCHHPSMNTGSNDTGATMMYFTALSIVSAETDGERWSVDPNKDNSGQKVWSV